MAANGFNARLSQVNLITKTDFDAKLTEKLTVLIEKLLKIKQNTCLLKMTWIS